jgi:cell division protein FtsL|tara:strand:+ start:429 stop:731 length:303 start_codon:yes stop_codon:yes gene_type:complete
LIRYPSFSFIFFIIFIAISLYQIKHSISQREINLKQINKNITETKYDISILKAELSNLKRPDRIERIAIDNLKMKPILPMDIWNLEDLINSKTLIEKGSS